MSPNILFQSPVPLQVSTETSWVSIAAGTYQAVARQANGSMWAWGSDTDGGSTGVGNSSIPLQFGTETSWITVVWRYTTTSP